MLPPLSHRYDCSLLLKFNDCHDHKPPKVTQDNTPQQNDEVHLLQLDPVEDILSTWLAGRNNSEAIEILNLWSALKRHQNFSMSTPSFEQILKLTSDLLEADGMNEFQLAMLSEIVSELRCSEGCFVQTLLNAIERRLIKDVENNLKNLTTFLLTFVTFEVNDRVLLDILIKKLKENLAINENVNISDLSRIVFAFAKLGYCHETFLSCLVVCINQKLEIAEFFTGKDLANIIWAYAELGKDSDEFISSLKSIIDQSLETHDFFSFSDAIKIVWALAVFKAEDKECIARLLSLIEQGLSSNNIASKEEKRQLFELSYISLVDISQYGCLFELVMDMRRSKIRKELRDKELSNCIFEVLKSIQCNPNNGILGCRVIKPSYIAGQSVLYPVCMKIAVGTKSFRSPHVQSADLNFAIEMSYPDRFLVRQEDNQPRRRGVRTMARLDKFMHLPKINNKKRFLERAGWKYAEIPHFKWNGRNSNQRTSFLSVLFMNIVKEGRAEINFIQRAQEELVSDLQRLSLEQIPEEYS